MTLIESKGRTNTTQILMFGQVKKSLITKFAWSQAMLSRKPTADYPMDE